MQRKKSNIVLIGMPGSGKSTVGIILAKLTSKNFIDTDVLIQLKEGRSLQDIVNTDGHMILRKIEEDVLLSVDCKNHVIATGGSAAYSHLAMAHLKEDGYVIFLNASLDTLQSRINNYETRGLAKRPDQTFADLFAERSALYLRNADIIVQSDEMTQEDVCLKILKELESQN